MQEQSQRFYVIVGGFGFAAISTLYLAPVVYLLLARFAKSRAEEDGRLTRELAEAESAGIAEPAE